MNDWLREQVEQYRAYLRTKPRVELYQVEIDAFVDWLERTGASPWRSVEDGLPPVHENGFSDFVFLLDDAGFQHVATRSLGKHGRWWWNTTGWGDTITHWMPTPPLLKESG